MTRRTPSDALASRLVLGAGRPPAADVTPDQSPDLPGKASKRAAAGHKAREAGAVAEAYIDGLCEALCASGRLWWLVVPDPMRVVRVLASGERVCVPTERAHATDRIGAVKVGMQAHMLAVEIKSTPHDASSWSYSELRPSQVASLEASARMGAAACVLLVALEANAIVRAVYVLPWEAGVGLPGADKRRSLALASDMAQRYRLTPAQALDWIDHEALGIPR